MSRRIEIRAALLLAGVYLGVLGCAQRGLSLEEPGERPIRWDAKNGTYVTAGGHDYIRFSAERSGSIPFLHDRSRGLLVVARMASLESREASSCREVEGYVFLFATWLDGVGHMESADLGCRKQGEVIWLRGRLDFAISHRSRLNERVQEGERLVSMTIEDISLTRAAGRPEDIIPRTLPKFEPRLSEWKLALESAIRQK